MIVLQNGAANRIDNINHGSAKVLIDDFVSGKKKIICLDDGTIKSYWRTETIAGVVFTRK